MSQPKEPELLNCPFCNSEPEWFEECSGIKTINWYIGCKSCGCQTIWSTCKDAVKQLWNKRV